MLNPELIKSNQKRFQTDWKFDISNIFFDGNSYDIEKFKLMSYLSNDARNIMRSAIIGLAADKSSAIYDFSFKMAELGITLAEEALSREDEVAYGEGYGDAEETLLTGRDSCKRVLAYANWILDGKPNMELFLQHAKALEWCLLYIKFKRNIIDDVSKPLYMSGNKDVLMELFSKYMKKKVDMNEIMYRPIKKYSTFLYYLSHFTPMSNEARNNTIIPSSIKYFYKLAMDWRINRQIYFIEEDRMIIAYIHGQYISGKVAPADFMQEIRGF